MTDARTRGADSPLGVNRPGTRPTILVVEDDADMVFALRRNLEMEGFDVISAADGNAGLAAVRTHTPRLVVLDVMLPGLDGFRVLRTMRAEGCETPVLLLTARSAEADKVYGFRLGADDFVTKPFGLHELFGRIGALLRRTGRDSRTDAPLPSVVRFGAVEIDMTARIIKRGGKEVLVSPRAYELLLALHRRAGAVASRRDLMAEVWGYSAGVSSRTLDTHIAELRRKIDDRAAGSRHIVTVWRVGYRLVR